MRSLKLSPGPLLGRVLAVATVVVVIILWSHVSSATASYLSRPGDVLHALGTWFSSSVMRQDIVTTLVESAIGFVAAMLIGGALAVLLGGSKLLSEVTAPYVAIGNALPKIALAPVFLLLFGLNMKAKVYFIAVSTAFTPFYAIYRSLTTLGDLYPNHARLLGASRRQLAWDVYVPAMAGALLATVRITEAFAILAAVVAEFVGATSGIGYQISQAQQSGSAAIVISGILLVAIIAAVVDLATRLIVGAAARRGGVVV